MRKRKSLFWLFLLCAGILFSVCQAAPTKSNTGKPVRGGSLVVAVGAKWSSLDPTKINARYADGFYLYQIYETLIGMDQSGNFVPSLAESWKMADDKTLVLKLKKGVKFHDGTDFNAQAVKYVLDWYRGPDTNPLFKSEIAEIESVEVVDDYSVKISLKESSSIVLSALSNYAGLMVSPSALKKYGVDYTRNPSGTGPFKVKEAVEGDHITLVRNEYYHEKGKDGKPLPYLDEVTIKVIIEDPVKLMNLRTGTVDLVDFLQIPSIETLKGNSNFNTIDTNVANAPVIGFNLLKAPFDDPNFRKAIYYAINRDEINKVITRGYGSVIPFAALKSQWFYSPNDPYKYDLKKAKELLAKSSYKGQKIKITIIAREPDTTIVQLLQQQLKKIGVELEIEPMERLAWVEKWTKKHDGEMALFRITVPKYDPYIQINENFGATSPNNYTLYKGQKFNEALQQSKRTFDISKRKTLLKQAQDAILADGPTLTLHTIPSITAYSKRVENVKTYYDGQWILKELWVNK